MSDAISSCTLVLDGEEIEDFKAFEEEEIETGREVPLMNKTKYAKKTLRYKMNVEYVVPTSGERDWSKLKDNDATLIITDDGGAVTTYYGVRLLSKGAKKRDGDSDVVIPMKLMATKRDPEL